MDGQWETASTPQLKILLMEAPLLTVPTKIALPICNPLKAVIIHGPLDHPQITLLMTSVIRLITLTIVITLLKSATVIKPAQESSTAQAAQVMTLACTTLLAMVMKAETACLVLKPALLVTLPALELLSALMILILPAKITLTVPMTTHALVAFSAIHLTLPAKMMLTTGTPLVTEDSELEKPLLLLLPPGHSYLQSSSMVMTILDHHTQLSAITPISMTLSSTTLPLQIALMMKATSMSLSTQWVDSQDLAPIPQTTQLELLMRQIGRLVTKLLPVAMNSPGLVATT